MYPCCIYSLTQFCPLNLKAGTGIAELIALEMSKQV